uniref:Uncharacterized protein n=1 Tax=viral metagenome TaxID=1070528 RepID=A0A6M3JBS4_9ZZZZ
MPVLCIRLNGKELSTPNPQPQHDRHWPQRYRPLLKPQFKPTYTIQPKTRIFSSTEIKEFCQRRKHNIQQLLSSWSEERERQQFWITGR